MWLNNNQEKKASHPLADLWQCAIFSYGANPEYIIITQTQYY